MSGGSLQLRRFRIAIRDGGTIENAAEQAGIGLAEARLIVAEDAKCPPPAEAFRLLGETAGRVTVAQGDCVDVLAARSGPLFDACVTDPPYHLTSIVKRFGGDAAAPAKPGATGAYARASRGFMGQTWDGGDVAFRPETWRAVFDQMKPGAFLAAFSHTRTYHRMAVAIEDAGFEISDQLAWVYGSGFPKSGWLKPAWEPIALARKPCVRSRKANVALLGTGALNIDRCRVEHDEECRPMAASQANINDPSDKFRQAGRREATLELKPNGRWPANLLHNGSEEVLAGFPGESKSGGSVCSPPSPKTEGIYGEYSRDGARFHGHADSGSAARFFYSAKAGPLDRLGSEHPTVKPIDLMRWLCRLVTPAGGLILDPFAGSGTTGIAAMAEGFSAELIDIEAKHVADIERKLASLRGEGGRVMEAHRKRKAERARVEPMPLFGDAA